MCMRAGSTCLAASACCMAMGTAGGRQALLTFSSTFAAMSKALPADVRVHFPLASLSAQASQASGCLVVQTHGGPCTGAGGFEFEHQHAALNQAAVEKDICKRTKDIIACAADGLMSRWLRL